MNTSMFNASVTMGQIQKKIDTISNNIANVNTFGYKRREATFSDLLFQQVNNQIVPSQEVGRLTPNGIRVGSGAKLAKTSLIMQQGSLKETGRQLDIALTDKNQLFQIQVVENGQTETRYTRAGAFYFSQNPENPQLLNLVDAQGHFVLGTNGPITVPANHTEIFFSENGTISVTLEDGSNQEVGQLEIVEVYRPQMLVQNGENLFSLPPNLEELGYIAADILDTIPVEQISMKQKFIEASNVDLSKEMTELMTAQRSYQFNARSVSMADQMMGLVNSIR